MSEAVDLDGVVAMLKGAAGKIRAHHEELSRLDALTGDGRCASTCFRAS